MSLAGFITLDTDTPSKSGLYVTGLPGVTLAQLDGITKDEQSDIDAAFEYIYALAQTNLKIDIQRALAQRFHIDRKLLSRETSKFTTDIITGYDLSGVKIDVSLSKYSVIHLITAEVFLDVPPIAEATINWTQGTAIASLISVAFGNNRYVAITSAGAIYSSPNGVNWTARTNPNASSLRSITFGNGIFLAVGDDSSVIYSEDGITWTEVTGLTPLIWWLVVWIEELQLFVAATNAASDFIRTSPNGITWTARETPAGTSADDVISIVYGNDVLLMVGDYVLRSTDGGLTWVEAENTPVNTCVAFGNGVFVSSNSSDVFMYSEDGIVWTTTDFAHAMARVIFVDDGYFLALNNNLAALSVDGINWYETTAIGNVDALGIAYNDGQFVFVTNTHTNYGQVSNAMLSLDVLVYDTDETGDLLGTFSIDSVTEGKNIIQINTDFTADDLYVAVDPNNGYLRESENRYFPTDRLVNGGQSCLFPCFSGQGSVTQVNGGGVNVKFNVVCSFDKFIEENINLFQYALWYRIGVDLMKERTVSDRVTRFTVLSPERAVELRDIFNTDYQAALESATMNIKMQEDTMCFLCKSPIKAVTSLP